MEGREFVPCTFPHRTQRQAEEHPYPFPRHGRLLFFTPSLHDREVLLPPFLVELCPHLHFTALVGKTGVVEAVPMLQQFLQIQDLLQNSPFLTQGQDLRPLVLELQDALPPLDLFLPQEQPFCFDTSGRVKEQNNRNKN